MRLSHTWKGNIMLFEEDYLTPEVLHDVVVPKNKVKYLKLHGKKFLP